MINARHHNYFRKSSALLHKLLITILYVAVFFNKLAQLSEISVVTHIPQFAFAFFEKKALSVDLQGPLLGKIHALESKVGNSCDEVPCFVRLRTWLGSA